MGKVGISGEIRDMCHLTSHDRPRRDAPPARRNRKHSVDGSKLTGCPPVMSDEVNERAVVTEDASAQRAGEGGRGFRDRVKGWLNVGWRGRNDPQDFGGSGLAFQSLAGLGQEPENAVRVRLALLHAMRLRGTCT